MNDRFPCPYFGSEVELTDERRRHVARRHPEVLPSHLDWIADTLRDPDIVVIDRKSDRAKLLVRWYDRPHGGNHVVVIVVTDRGFPDRHWIVSARVSRRLPRGVVAWQRS